MAVNPYASGTSTPVTKKKRKARNPYASGTSTPVTPVTPEPPVEEVVLGAMAGQDDIGGPGDLSGDYLDSSSRGAPRYKSVESGGGGGTTPTTGASATGSIGGNGAQDFNSPENIAARERSQRYSGLAASGVNVPELQEGLPTYIPQNVVSSPDNAPYDPFVPPEGYGTQYSDPFAPTTPVDAPDLPYGRPGPSPIPSGDDPFVATTEYVDESQGDSVMGGPGGLDADFLDNNRVDSVRGGPGGLDEDFIDNNRVDSVRGGPGGLDADFLDDNTMPVTGGAGDLGEDYLANNRVDDEIIKSVMGGAGDIGEDYVESSKKPILAGPGDLGEDYIESNRVNRSGSRGDVDNEIIKSVIGGAGDIGEDYLESSRVPVVGGAGDLNEDYLESSRVGNQRGEPVTGGAGDLGEDYLESNTSGGDGAVDGMSIDDYESILNDNRPDSVATEQPATLDGLTDDVTQLLSDRLGMDGGNPAIDRDIADYMRQSEREEAQLMEDLNRMGVIRSGDTAEALGDLRGARSRTIADLEARGYDQQSDAIRDILDVQRGQRDEQLTQEEITSGQLDRELLEAGQTGKFRGRDTMSERALLDDLTSSSLNREISEAGQTGQFRESDTLAERALSDDLRTSNEARKMARNANTRANRITDQQVADSILGRTVMTDENQRAASRATDDLLTTAQDRDIQKSAVTGMYDDDPTIQRENQLVSQILSLTEPDEMSASRRGDFAQVLARGLDPDLQGVLAGLGDDHYIKQEPLSNPPPGVTFTRSLDGGKQMGDDGVVYTLREGDDGTYEWIAGD